MDVKDFDYNLPKELIAQDPIEDRSSSRLLVLDRKTGGTTHRVFRDIVEYLRPGDCLVINNTKVIPARLLGTREGHTGTVEILLLKRESADVWETLVRPGRKLREGARVTFGNGELKAEILEVLPDGNRRVQLLYDGIFEEVLDRLGKMPLPPYITHELKDKNRYQTVYAKYDGSAAAPTAGLHFTPELLEKIKEMGVDIVEITLHVGLGTFRPVKVDKVEDHLMHSEYYEINEEAAGKINKARDEGGRVICVGTTSCRTLESAAAEEIKAAAAGDTHADASKIRINPRKGWTDIFIYPGYEFKVMDGLITNFHLPESTLIMLVSAFAGREHVLSAYEEAVREKYRFFSFGDAMLIL